MNRIGRRLPRGACAMLAVALAMLCAACARQPAKAPSPPAASTPPSTDARTPPATPAVRGKGPLPMGEGTYRTDDPLWPDLGMTVSQIGVSFPAAP